MFKVATVNIYRGLFGRVLDVKNSKVGRPGGLGSPALRKLAVSSDLLDYVNVPAA